MELLFCAASLLCCRCFCHVMSRCHVVFFTYLLLSQIAQLDREKHDVASKLSEVCLSLMHATFSLLTNL